jgi:hypothetical protein
MNTRGSGSPLLASGRGRDRRELAPPWSDCDEGAGDDLLVSSLGPRWSHGATALGESRADTYFVLPIFLGFTDNYRSKRKRAQRLARTVQVRPRSPISGLPASM